MKGSLGHCKSTSLIVTSQSKFVKYILIKKTANLISNLPNNITENMN